MKIINITKQITFWLLLLISTWSHSLSGQSLSLDSCLSMAERNYPQIAQYGLISQSTEYSIANAQKGKLPQLSIAGQATYQSDVTQVPGGEAMGVAPLSQDQYQLYGEVVQPLTGLAVINQQKKIIEADGQVSKAELEAKLYAIKQRVSDLFFGVLLIQNQLRQSELTKQDLQAGISRVEASVKYGTSLKSSADVLKAQLITIDQRIIEKESTRDGYLKMLGLFVNQELNSDFELIVPAPTVLASKINRPELSIYTNKMQSIALQDGLLSKTNLPQFSLFMQSGFGRPALNFLSNDFEPYYIGGLRLSWNLSNYYTTKGQRQLFSINKSILESERETFLFNTRLTMANQDVQIVKVEKLIEKDKEIIALREGIVNSSKGQLEHGVITASEYKTVVIDSDEARQNLTLHQIELMKLKNDYKLTSGN
ncbi:TolC family protein [Reichenbachiella ulvae]|uniref:TolC family protein n=1 Tax=Reichenbachiella ulvae TaxID=2980104 RepID=A0ABT3CR74_9BACT|nr:TolC family protein [Reichenbachiella ulvae]MCV9386071.1 TolC family protein [Reichenbachiella ulvae]